MLEENTERELKDRLALIESMITEGRRTTENWGWVFVLWGVAYYVAIAWSMWGHAALAWVVTMVAALLLTAILASLKRRSSSHGTTMGRAVSAIWASLGVSLFVVLQSLGMTGRYDSPVFIAIIGAMLGMANAASGLLLRWKMQLACAVVWWASAVLACFGSAGAGEIGFLTAIFFCQIVFGVYAMMLEARRRRRGGVVHA